MKNKILEILKNNKTVVVVVLISIFPIYFWGVRPAQIRKQCSTVTETDSYQYANHDYNEVAEKQKQEALGEYIHCRNSNLSEGDQTLLPLGSPYAFTQDQIDTLPLDKLDQLILGKVSPLDFVAYIYSDKGYFIDNPTYDDLKANKDKYPQCSFPGDFIQKDTWGSSVSTKNASDAEYKSCLRKNGLEN